MTTTNKTTTTNGATQFRLDPVVEFFTQVGASVGDIEALSELFYSAVKCNKDFAIRSLLWSYDCRGGAGRRSNFLELLPRAINNGLLNVYEVSAIIDKIPELGRWDAVYKIAERVEPAGVQLYSLCKIVNALNNGDSLCAKWMPRKGLMAARIRGLMHKSAKEYRKILVNNTNVVESLMSKGKWSEIQYEHVPSVAGARYRAAFDRHDEERHAEYINSVRSGEAKMNTNVLYPHDVARMLSAGVSESVVDATWGNLPSILEDVGNIVCMADVSGSMCCTVSGMVSAMEVAISLGIYFAERATGLWNNKLVTYSGEPEILDLSGLSGFCEKYEAVLEGSPDPYNTDIQSAYREILKVCISGKVPQEQMPKALLILSDMQFDNIGPKSIDEDIKQSFEDAGYMVPKLIYWNLNSACNGVPISSALSANSVEYSGFTPRGIETVLGSRTMIDLMLDTINNERYDWQPANRTTNHTTKQKGGKNECNH